MQQVLVTFGDETSEADVQAYVTTIRRLRGVSRVEFLTARETASLARRPTDDGENPDVTVRADEMFFKGPDGALLAKLNEKEAEVIKLLTHRRRLGERPLKGRDGLLAGLRAFSPGVWNSVKSASSATDAYAGALKQFAGTEWELIDKRGVYGFRSDGS